MATPTHKEIIDYFKNLNTQLVDFEENSFFRIDLQEVFGAFRSGINLPCFIAESPEIQTPESSVSSSSVTRTLGFMILKNPIRDDYDQQNQFIDDCEAIAWKILTRMRYDSTKPTSILYNRFRVETIKIIKVGPLYDELLYGVRATVEITGHESLQVNSDDWNDLESNC